VVAVRRGQRVSRVVRVLGPAALTAVALVFVYFVAPLDRGWTAHTGLLLGIGLLVVGALVAWQTRAIARSPYPRLRAAAVLALSFPPLILLFAGAYVVLARDHSGAFSQPLTRVDGLYFSMTVFATVGFGDIVARTSEAKLAVAGQMVCDLVYVGLVVRAIMAAAQLGLRNTVGSDPEPGAEDPSRRPVNPPERARWRRRPGS
jgi:hypothetical protein